jgi:hypothetical protein
MDLTQFSDEELQQIAGNQQDFSSISDDELMKIAGVQTPQIEEQKIRDLSQKAGLDFGEVMKLKTEAEGTPLKTKLGLFGSKEERLARLGEVQARREEKGGLRDVAGMRTAGALSPARFGMKGYTFGLGQQAVDVAKAGLGEQTLKEEQEKRKAREELTKMLYPGISTTSEITGGVASPINILGAKASKMAGGKLLGAVTGGGVEGVIAGLGYTEDLTNPTKVVDDMVKGGLYGSLTASGLYGIGKGVSAISPIIARPFQRFTNQKKLASKNIGKMLVKEGVDPKVALQKMTDEGLDLIDVVDQRSAIVSSLPEKAYEKASVDLVDDYTKRLNKAGNKAREEILDMVSNKKITDLEGAELMGKNAQETINRQLKIRSAKAKPLYEKAFNQKKAQAILGKRDEILKRPVLKEAIRKTKAESRKFGKTTVGSLGKEIPLELDDLTDEFYQFTDFRKAYKHFKELELSPEVAKKYRDFANPLRDKDKKEAFRTFYKEVSNNNSLMTLHQAKDYLYRKSKDFTDLESARYKQVYNELSSKLKAKSPTYRQATEVWAGETEGLERLYKQKGIGNLAKKYANNDIDGIRSSMKNIFKPTTSIEEINRIKQSMPAEEFQAIVRKDLSGMIEDAGEKGRVLDIALFGQAEDVGLKNRKLDLIFTPTEKKGLKKAVGIIDKARIRAKETAKIKFGKGAVQEAKHVSFNKIRMLANTINKIQESPQYREEFIRFITTPEGKQILEMMSKSSAKNTEALLFNLLGAIETTKRE